MNIAENDSIEGDGRLSSNFSRDDRFYVYIAYGLKIASQIAIPEFADIETIDGNAEVEMTFLEDKLPQDCVPVEVAAEEMALQSQPDFALLYMKDTGVFIVEKGQKITIVPNPQASLIKIRQTAIGKAMAILLCQRKYLILHGSGVLLNGSVAIFLGNSGDGKSTTAATLHRLGHPLITDDVAAIDLTRNATIHPTYPQLKLAETTGQALGYRSLGKLDSPLNKHWYRFSQVTEQKPLSVGAIYVLAKGSQLQIESLPPQKALTVLMQHSSHNLLFHQQEMHHFLQCTTLARRVPVYRLQRSFDLDLLSQLGKSLEEHFISQLST